MLAGLGPDIVVGRVLSAYSAADVQDNQLKITYSVYNQQAEDVSGVLLTTTLQEGVSLVTATQLPDQNGRELAWSLGTLPAYGRASVEVTVGLAGGSVLMLDSGAAALGTVNARASSDTAPPATLDADPLPAALLASTPDANTTDPFIQEKAAALDYSPQNIIAYLKEDVGYESYSGSLRGARGTLWSSAGNALDEASLGVALFRASGIPAQYAQGALPDPLAQQLILSMFREPSQVVGYIPPGTDVADPANDPQLLAETREHYWIQFDVGGGLQDVDTTFSHAQAGQTFHAGAATTFAEVDDALRHKVRVKLEAETFSQLGAAFGLDGGFGTKTVLDETFNSVDLVGRPLSIGHFVSETSIPSPIFVSRTITYAPYVRLGDTAFDLSTDDLTRGDDYQEVLTNFPLGTQALTGLFLKMAVSGPDKPTENFERALVDRVGFAARQGGSASNLSIDPNGPAAITDFDIHTLYAVSSLTHFSVPVRTGVALQQVGQDFSLPHGLDEAAQSEKLAPLLREFFVGETRAVAEAFLRVSDHLTARLASSSLVKAYTDEPRLIIASNRIIHDEATGNSTAVVSMDLRSDEVRAIAFPGQADVAVTSFNTVRGLTQNATESDVPSVVVAAVENVPPAISTIHVFEAAERQEIDLATITSDNLSLLHSLQISADAKARITIAVSEGNVVVVPQRNVDLNGESTIGWYQVDPADGNTIGVMEDGGHLSILSWTLLGAAATAAVLGLAIGLAHGGDPLTGIPNAAKDVGKGLGQFGEGLGRAAPSLIPALKGAFKFVVIKLVDLGAFGDHTRSVSEWASKIDPSAAGSLLGFPPMDSSNVASMAISVPAGLAGGDVQGTVALPNLTISGQIQALWNSAAINIFQSNSLLSMNATVRDIDGASLGSGTVALTASASLSVSGNVSYQVDGTGGLAFYAPAITNLGVSGDWKSYSAQISGTVTLTITTDRLTLNGVLLAPGTYTISTTSATLTGSGTTSSPDFAGSVAIAVTGGTLELGPAGGNMSLAGLPLDLSDGATFTGYSGNISVTADDGTDTVTLNGNAGAALRIVGFPAALETNQNATATFDVAVLTSLEDMYEVTAIAPAGWTIGFDATGRVTVKSRPGLQGGTFPIRLVARSLSDPDLVAAADVMVTVTPTLPGLEFDVLADDQFTVPFFGAEVPTAFRTTVRNLGPAADSYQLSFPNPPAGFSIFPSKTIATVPAGEMGIVGIYLEPSAQMPAPGTPVSFTVTATSLSDPAITQFETITFNMPAVAAVTVESDPPAVATIPGAAVSAEMTIKNVGNVPYNLAVGATLPDGLAISGLTTPVLLAVGETTTQTVTFTPSANTPLNSTLTPTIIYGPAVDQDFAAIVQVNTDDSHVDAGQTVQISADVLAGTLQAQVGSAAFVVRDATGAVVFQSSEVPVSLDATAAASTIDLGPLNTAGFAAGEYTIEAIVRDSNQQPLTSAVGVGTLVVGLPLVATQQVTPSTLTEGLELTYVTGNATIESRVTIAAQPLVSLVDTNGAALDVAVNGSLAYVAGTQDVSIVDLSDPASPEVVGTFGKSDLAQDALNVLQLSGNNLIVASQNTLNANLSNLLVYSLANPRSPQLLSNTTVPYRFITDLLVQGSTALLPTGGITFSLPGSITGQFGDVVAVNFSSPGNPVVADALFNTSGSPDGGNTRQTGGTVVNNRLAYIGSTTAAGSNSEGVGRLLVIDTSNPADLAVVRELLIPGTAHVLDVVIEGDRALVVGSSGGTRNPFNGFGDLGLTGNLTLTVLDISDPQNPQPLGTTAVTDAEFPQGTAPGLLQAVALGSGRFAVSGVQLPDVGPVIVVADASDPTAIEERHLAVPSLVNGLSVSGDFLHATSAAGLATYRIDAIAELPVHVEVTVPTGAGVTRISDSFSLAPTQIIAGADFDTLVWDLTLGGDQPSQELTWQSDITGMLPGTVRNVTLSTSIAFVTAGGTNNLSLPAQTVASVPATQTLQIPVRVVVPGADAIASAAARAVQIGRRDLGNRLNDLTTALTNLVQNPTSEIALSQSLASMDSVIVQMRADRFLVQLVEDLQAARELLAGAIGTEAVQSAVLQLGNVLDGLDRLLRDVFEHGFELRLLQNQATVQPDVPARFHIFLQNNGTQTTTYDLSLSGVPAGNVVAFNQTSITLAPGEAVGASGATQELFFTITPAGGSLAAFGFELTAVPREAPLLATSTEGALALRSEFIGVAAVTLSTPFTQAGTPVDVTVKITSAVNAATPVAVFYQVKDSAGQIVFTSAGVPATLTVQSPLTSVDLETLSTSGLANGSYVVEAIVNDASGQPIPGANGFSTLLIGTPVSASLTVSERGGLNAEFFDFAIGLSALPDLTGLIPDVVRLDHQVNYPSTGAAWEGLDTRFVETYASRHTGVINILEDGDYTFFLSSDDGSKMWLDGELVINNDGLHGMVERSATRTQTAGFHDLRIEFFENGGDAGLILSWAGPGIIKQVIPESFLSPEPAVVGTSLTLPPGSHTVTNSLQITAQTAFTNPLTFQGLVDTNGLANSVVTHGTVAYVSGSNDISIVDISDPTNPQVLSTFAESLIVQGGFNISRIVGDRLIVGTTTTLNANGFNVLVYDLADPLNPALVSSTPVSRRFLTDFLVQGSTVLASTNGVFLFFGGQIFDQFGNVISLDLSDPNAPVVADSLFNNRGPLDGGDTWQLGGTFANDTIAYIASTTSVGGNTQSGTGRILVVDTADPADLKLVKSVEIPGTVYLQDVAVQGNLALAVGSTAGIQNPSGTTDSGFTGNLALTLLDITNPLDPQIIGSPLVTTATFPRGNIVGKLDAVSLGNGLFAVSEAIADGQPALLLVDPSDPNNLVVTFSPMPVLQNGIEVVGDKLYTTSSAGLTIFDIGTIQSTPLVASVQVPKNTGVTLDPDSFNVPPTEIVVGDTFDTLVWNRTLAFGNTDLRFTWRETISNLLAAEQRNVTLATAITLAQPGGPETISLPSLVVTGQPSVSQVNVTLAPSARSVQPGETTTFIVTVNNPSDTPAEFDLAVAGLPAEWVSLDQTVSVPANGSVQLPLEVSADVFAELGQRGLTVIVTSAAQQGFVQGTLELTGPAPIVDPHSHGVVVALTSIRETAGQETSAAYTVRITNTGSATETFSLSAALPAGVSGAFSHSTIIVPPGASNFREVQLLLTPSSAAILGESSFRVDAVAEGDASVTDSATGTLIRVSQGVRVALSPAAGSPGSFDMTITNTGLGDDTFELAVGGPGGLVASLRTSRVSLAAGASRTVRIDAGTIDFATPGAIALFGIATSRTNSAVRNAARADIVIPEQQAVAARFEEDSIELPGPGPATVLLLVDNLGNIEDAYTATIEETNGPLSATLIGIDGLPTQTVPVFRLPGLATGAILVNLNMAETGVGGLRVRIRSLSEPEEVTSVATLAVVVPSAVEGMRLDCSPLHVGLNTCTVLGATKGGVANLAVGVHPGERRLSKFGVTVGMADPTIVAQGIVQPDGRALVQVLISSDELLHRILLQAFEQVPTPRTTNIEVVGTPMLSSGPQGTHTVPLDPGKLPALQSEAIAKWEATGLTLSESVLLRSARIETADLASGLLGQTIGSTIYVDTTADGHGWFVDPSPSDDVEFATVTASSERTAVGTAPPMGRIDLLTVLMHEYGHILGSDDMDAQEGRALMTQELPLATRRLPGEDAVVAANALDVNRDGLVSPIDALLVINYLNRAGSNPLTLRSSSLARDVNRDGLIAPLDALLVINHLNRNSLSSLPGEGESPRRTWGEVDSLRQVDPVYDWEISDALLDELTAPSSRTSVHESIADTVFEELSGMLEE